MKKSMFHFFPEEIWENILKRLPSKSLCRFLSVSKPWCRLITSPDFISSNLNHNLNTETNNYVLLNVFRQFRNYTFQFNDPDDWVQEFLFYTHNQIMNIGVSNSLGEPSFNPKLPFQSDEVFYSVLGSCNGLICLKGPFDDMILWNPSIQKFVKLQPFRNVEPSSNLEQRQRIGFGVNLLNGDFKVIRIVMESYDYDLVDQPPPAPPMVEVFSLRRGTWAEVSEVSFNPFCFRSSHMYLNGLSHWVCELVANDGQQCSLVSFDMSDEVFREVSLPQQLAQLGRHYLVKIRLVTVTLMEKECLAMAIFDERVRSNASFHIWAMKEYGVVESWTNIYTINLEFIRPVNIVELMGTNDNILMMEDQTKLTCYDLATKSVSEFDISCEGLQKYTDTLALLEPRISI